MFRLMGVYKPELAATLETVKSLETLSVSNGKEQMFDLALKDPDEALKLYGTLKKVTKVTLHDCKHVHGGFSEPCHVV